MSDHFRAGECLSQSPHQRQDRFIQTGNQYFYKTRESGCNGPFVRKIDAIFDLIVFIEMNAEEDSISA